MIGRRAILSGAVAVIPRIASLAREPSYQRCLAFNVVRQDSVIGTHVLTFTRHDAGLDVAIAVDIAVGFGPLTLFRYKLRALEQWREGRVAHVDATTNDDGITDVMRADRNAQGLWVQGSKASRYLAPTDALPATHWNMAELAVPWINPQDGRLFRPSVQLTGTAPIRLAGGGTRAAAHYAVTGDLSLEICYDAADQWCALSFKAKDDSLVHYELA
jgi:hypothetical protein